MEIIELSKIKGFEWDEGNINKNWRKHKVTDAECEEVFFNQPLMIELNKTHSITERRYFVLGKTDRERLLFVVFTIRNNKIRIISGRKMNKKERRQYEKTSQV